MGLAGTARLQGLRLHDNGTLDRGALEKHLAIRIDVFTMRLSSQFGLRNFDQPSRTQLARPWPESCSAYRSYRASAPALMIAIVLSSSQPTTPFRFVLSEDVSPRSIPSRNDLASLPASNCVDAME